MYVIFMISAPSGGGFFVFSDKSVVKFLCFKSNIFKSFNSLSMTSFFISLFLDLIFLATSNFSGEYFVSASDANSFLLSSKFSSLHHNSLKSFPIIDATFGNIESALDL